MADSLMEFTDANWKSEVLDSPIPVMVDFWAPWCNPCVMLKPTIEKPVVRVKICGLTRIDEALACAAAGADWIGLNLFPGSPRYVRPREAAQIRAALPEAVSAVGVFVNRPAAEVARIAAELGLRI